MGGEEVSIYTRRLDIREIEYADAMAYYKYASNVEVARLAGFRPVPDLATAQRLVTGMVYQGDTYSIFLKGTNTLIGTCNLYRKSIRKIKDVYTLGISLDKNYWGYGFGSETIGGLIKYAFKAKKARLLEIMCELNNKRSRTMIEHLGFNLDGIIKKYGQLYDGTIYDIALYSMTKEEFEEKNVWKKY